MKIEFIDTLSFDVYLKKEETKNINMKEKKQAEDYLRKIIDKLMKKFDITIEGFYNIIIYIDKYYGVILNFKKEKLDYYECFNGVEINMKLKEVDFLYKVDDIPFNILDKLEIKKINNDIYLRIISKLNQKDFMSLVEHAEKIIKIC